MKVKGRGFDERDLQLLTALANYAAIAIDNASLVTDLKTEKKKLETILTETAEAVLVVDEQRHILLCNRSARRAFDLKGDPFNGSRAEDVISNQDLLMLLRQPQGTDPMPQTEITLDDGRTLSANVSPVDGSFDIRLPHGGYKVWVTPHDPSYMGPKIEPIRVPPTTTVNLGTLYLL